MSELRTSAVVDLKGNLEQRAQRYERSMRQMSRRGSRYLRGLGGAARHAGRGLDAIGSRWTAIGGGAALFAGGRAVVKLEERLVRLGNSADSSSEQMEKLKKRVFEVAMDPNVRASPDSLLGVVEEIVERTGDLDFAMKNLENFGRVVQATNARGLDVGGVGAEFQKMGLTDPDEVKRALEVLTVQGEQGAITMDKLARLGPRVFSAYTALGRSGVPAVRELGAAMQVIMRGIGEPEQTATAFEALLRELAKPEITKKLQQGGIQVFDQEALKEGREVLRPINELMIDIVERADGKKSVLNSVFSSEEATRAFNSLLGKSGDESQRLLDNLAGIEGSTNRVGERSRKAADTASEALNSLYTAFQKFADDELTEPIQALADLVNSLDQADWDKIATTLKWGGIALGSAVVARKGFQGVQSARRAFGKGGAAGAVSDFAGGSFQSPIPVYVVNKGFGGRGGRGGGAGAAARRGARTSVRKPGAFRMARAAPNLRTLGTLGLGAAGMASLSVTGAGAAGYGAGTLINEYGLKGTKAGNTIGRTVAMLMSGLGSDTARDALMADAQAQGRRGGDTRITLGIEDDRVRLKSVAGPGPGVRQVDVDVDSGPMMPGGD